MTRQLLELLWVLEATLNVYPSQASLMERVMAGPCFLENELPCLPDDRVVGPCEMVDDGEEYSLRS